MASKGEDGKAAGARAFASTEAVCIFAAAIVAGDVSHFTWWAFVVLGIYDVASCLPTGIFGHGVEMRAWAVAASCSAMVQLAVVYMSAVRCDLLGDTVKDIGTWAFLLGNFVLHHYPTLRLILAPRPAQLLNRRKWLPPHGDAARAIAVYTSMHQPAGIYGCSAPGRVVIIVSAAVFGLLVEAGLMLVRRHCSR